MKNADQANTILTDTPYIHLDGLPVWMVIVSGWGDPNLEEGYKRMLISKNIAAEWKINIEFSTRLGTLQSYKNAPAVANEIMEHNEKVFAVYEKILGKDWRQRFVQELNEQIKDTDLPDR